jgi:alpha-1,6-mannosyltransferase
MASAGHPHALRPPARRLTPAAGLRLARQGLGLASLAVMALCAWVIVTGAAWRPTQLVPSRQGGFEPWLRGPLDSFGGHLPYPDFAQWMVLMLAAWVLALVTVPALRTRWIVVAVVAAHVLFVLGPPLISADVFGYIDWARMGALHGLNPYATDSGAVVSDAVYPFVRWDHYTSPYGPLFTLISYALVPLGVAANLWALKLLVLGASLGCAALGWASARELGRDPRLGLVLYGLNPAVLVYAVGGVHNDVLMMLGVMTGVWLVLRERERAGAVAISLAVAIKASAGLAVPFLLLGSRDRRGALIAAVSTGAAVLAVSLAIFGTHAFDFVNVLRTQQVLDSGTSVIAQLGGILGWSGNPPKVRTAASIAFVIFLIAMLWRAWRQPETWLDGAAWATAALMAATSWLLAWYIVWLVPLAALARSRWLQLVAAGFTGFVILARMAPFL